MEIINRERYRHHRTGNVYVITDIISYKIGGVWTKSIIYKDGEGKQWGRTEENFKEKFTQLTTNLSDDDIIEILIDRDNLKHNAPMGKRTGSTKKGKVMRRYYLFRKAYKKEGRSQLQVARMFNLKEHTTVFHGLKQVGLLIETNNKEFLEIKREYDKLFNARSFQKE